MEFIINFGIYLLIGGLIGYVSTVAIMHTIKTNKDVYEDRDVSIEWNGPDIYLRDKVYDNVEKPLEINDNKKYIGAENKRIENVTRSNERNRRTNKVDAIGFDTNNSEDES